MWGLIWDQECCSGTSDLMAGVGLRACAKAMGELDEAVVAWLRAPLMGPCCACDGPVGRSVPQRIYIRTLSDT